MGQTKEINPGRLLNAVERRQAHNDMQNVIRKFLKGDNVRELKVEGPASGIASTLVSRDPLTVAYARRFLVGE